MQSAHKRYIGLTLPHCLHTIFHRLVYLFVQIVYGLHYSTSNSAATHASVIAAGAVATG